MELTRCELSQGGTHSNCKESYAMLCYAMLHYVACAMCVVCVLHSKGNYASMIVVIVVEGFMVVNIEGIAIANVEGFVIISVKDSRIANVEGFVIIIVKGFIIVSVEGFLIDRNMDQ